jgi:hypothetical protein
MERGGIVGIVGRPDGERRTCWETECREEEYGSRTRETHRR